MLGQEFAELVGGLAAEVDVVAGPPGFVDVVLVIFAILPLVADICSNAQLSSVLQSGKLRSKLPKEHFAMSPNRNEV